jgi:hypothetical protein
LHIPGAAFASDSILDEVPGFGHSHVRVNVNDLRLLAANDDFTPLASGSGLLKARSKTQRRISATASCEQDSRSRPRRTS